MISFIRTYQFCQEELLILYHLWVSTVLRLFLAQVTDHLNTYTNLFEFKTQKLTNITLICDTSLVCSILLCLVWLVNFSSDMNYKNENFFLFNQMGVFENFFLSTHWSLFITAISKHMPMSISTNLLIHTLLPVHYCNSKHMPLSISTNCGLIWS